MTTDDIFNNADKRRAAGVSNKSQFIGIGLDVMSTIEKVRETNPNISGEAVAMKILFDMFEKYK